MTSSDVISTGKYDFKKSWPDAGATENDIAAANKNPSVPVGSGC